MQKVTKAVLVSLAIGIFAAAPVAQISALSESSNTIVNSLVSSVVTVSSNGPVSIDLTPTASSVTSIAGDTVSVSTNSSTGYVLTMSVNSTTSNQLVKDADTINATSGTYSTPAVLDLNSWGYRIDGLGSFGAGPTSAITNLASSSLTWASVPVSTSAQTIRSSSVPVINDTISVWYGVRINLAKPAGTYTNTVIYTATAN